MTPRSKRRTGVVLFFLGIALIIIDYLSVMYYTNAHADNYLAPAGQFIPGDDTFSFAVLGDSVLSNPPLGEILSDIVGRDFAFAVNVGDQAMRQTTAHFEWLLQELRQEIGNFPFYAVPGNHDITMEHGERRLRFYKRAFGQPDYWFSYGDALFVCLDTSTRELSDGQAVWLESTLLRLRGSFKSCLIFMHVPPIDLRAGENSCMRRGVDRLRQIVQANKITAIVAGHTHEYLQSEFGGVPLYVAPSSGQAMHGEADMFGYLAVTVEANGDVSVREVPVTRESGREYMEYYFSTEVQRYRVVEIGLIFVMAGFWLVASSHGVAFPASVPDQDSESDDGD